MGSCSRQFLGGETSCARGKSHQVRWLCIKFFLLLVLSLYSSSAQTAKSDSAPDQLQQHYDAARTFQLGGDQEHAASEYKAFLVKALRSIANARVQTGELDAAAGLLDEVLRFSPDDEDVRLDYALVRLQQSNLPEARSRAEKVVQSSPTNAKAHALLGRILFDQRDYKAAQEQLEAAVIAAPNFDVGYLLGVTYIRLNDLSRARLLFDEMLTGLGDTAQLHLYFGRAYREGEWEALDNSIQEFKKALAKDSKLPEAHYFLALAYLVRDGESGFSAAVQELQAELKISPDDYRSHYLLGYIAMKSHDPKAAESELLRAASLESQNPDPLVFLGQLYSDAGRDREAEVTVRKAIALTTDVSRNDYQINRAHYVLARILLRTGRQEEAEKELAVSKELRDRVMHPELARNNKFAEFASPTLDNGPARPVVTAAASFPEEQKKAQDYVSQLKPAIGEAYNNLGVIAAGRRDFVIAVDDFRKAAEWNPALESIDRNWGMAGFYAGQYNQAVAPLARHLQTHEDDLRVRAALGLSYYTLGNYPQALETLRPIESQVNDDPGLSYAFAMSLVKTGDYTKGVARLKSLERANPNSAEVHTLLGEAFADQAEYSTALEEYRKALAIDPHQAQTHFLAGLALIHQGNPKDAAPELRLALALNPNNVSGKYHLAFALIQIQQKEEATLLLQEVLREDPKYVDAYYELGKMQLEKGDSKAAISSFEAGIKLSPESDHIHYQLAMAYRRESRTEDAEREIKLYQTLKNRRRGRDAAQPN